MLQRKPNRPKMADAKAYRIVFHINSFFVVLFLSISVLDYKAGDYDILAGDLTFVLLGTALAAFCWMKGNESV